MTTEKNPERMFMLATGGVSSAVVAGVDGTLYALVLVPIVEPETAALLGCTPGDVMVAVWPHTVHSAAAFFRPNGGYLSDDYVAQKLNLGEVDARRVAAILGRYLGRPTG